MLCTHTDGLSPALSSALPCARATALASLPAPTHHYRRVVLVLHNFLETYTCAMSFSLALFSLSHSASLLVHIRAASSLPTHAVHEHSDQQPATAMDSLVEEVHLCFSLPLELQLLLHNLFPVQRLDTPISSDSQDAITCLIHWASDSAFSLLAVFRECCSCSWASNCCRILRSNSYEEPQSNG